MATTITRGTTKAVFVLGAGPAGTALAIALARAGVPVALVDPRRTLEYPNSYGAFLSHVESLELETVSKAVRRNARFVFRDGAVSYLDEEYVRFDRSTFEREFESLLSRFSVERIVERVVGVDRTSDGFSVAFGGGASAHAKLVIDARGKDAFPEGAAPRAFQSALGLWLRPKEESSEALDATLMDFRHPSGDRGETFLYRVPRDEDGLLFVQETVLAKQRIADFSWLEARLSERLDADGSGPFEVVKRERCVIPLGLPLPRETSWPRFGAAASYTQPASGYQLARALRAAPRVAEAIAERLADPVERLVRATNAAVWTTEERSARRYFDFGLEVLLRLDAESQEDFLRTFVNLGSSSVASYMEGLSAPPALRRVMWNQFVASRPRLRRAVAVAGTRALTKKLTRSLSIFQGSPGESA